MTVALMPCSAKKFECNRPEMCDQRLQGRRLRADDAGTGQDDPRGGLDLPKLAKSDFDDPFGTATGSGVIFGATGGVMEAALRTVLELVTGEKVEKLLRPRRHRSAPRIRGRALRRDAGDQGRAGPGIVQHLFPDWDWLRGATLEGGRRSRHGQRQEGDGGHPRRRPLQPMPFHRVHGLSGRLPGRRRAADPHQPRHPRRPGPGDLLRGHAYSVRKSHENPADLCRSTSSSSPAAPAGTRATNCCTPPTRRAASSWIDLTRKGAGAPAGAPAPFLFGAHARAPRAPQTHPSPSAQC